MKTKIMTMLNLIDPNDAVGKHLHQMALILLRQEELVMEIQRQRFLSQKARTHPILSQPEVAIRSEPPGTAAVAAASASASAVAPSFNDGEVLEADKTEERVVLEKPNLNALGQKRKHVQEKHDPNVLGQKRKAETPLLSTNDHIQPFDKVKEWRCALCRVTVRNEGSFKQHLRGKKHKHREEDRLRTRKASNVSRDMHEQLPNKRRKLSSGSAGAKEHESKVGRTLQCDKTGLNATIPNFMKPYATKDKQHKFKFWCEKCKVGANTTNNMFGHLNGKKHRANHQE